MTHVIVERLWNGDPCPDERVRADITLTEKPDGLHMRAEAPRLHDQKIPDAPIGSRVEGLWEYDVVEVFLVGPGHRYLEVELGAGGHFLVLSFDSLRHRSNAHEDLHPLLRFEKTSEKLWVSEITLPWGLVPENVRAMNAFVIAAGQFLAMAPVPGVKPDFHQPDFFPPFRLSSARTA